MKYWLNTSENTFQGKVWAAPLYLLGIPFVWNKTLFHKAGLNPNSPPKTFPQLLSDCSALKKAGITPFIMGDNEQSVGSWFMSTIALGDFNSVKQVLQLSLGSGSGNATWVSQLGQLYSNKCFNDDIANLPAQQGFNEFAQGKGAMELATDGQVAQAEKVLQEGEHRRGQVPRCREWQARRGLRRDAVVERDDHVMVAAQGGGRDVPCVVAHAGEPDELVQGDRGVPGRQPLPRLGGQGSARQAAAQARPVSGSVWLENFLPPQVDQNADLAGGELITSGSASPAKVVKLWKSQLSQWKSQHPDEFNSYKKWVTTG